MSRPASTDRSFSTLTHARLRALQGDRAAAESLLSELLSRQPDHGEARELLRSIRQDPCDDRIRRLEAWLARILRSD